jgi:predicted CXXCH cytochrome family protein
MSCHDGVTSIDAVHNAGVLEGTGTAAIHPPKAGAFFSGAITSSGNLTTDLSDTHPINFRVTNNSQADLNYVAPATVMGPVLPSTAVATGIPSTVTYPLFRSTGNGGNRLLGTDYLECGSCHAVHDSQYRPFLRETMGKSTLCLGCHNK